MKKPDNPPAPVFLESSISFAPELDNLSIAAQLLDEFSDQLGQNITFTDKVELALCEAVSNAVKHAGASGEQGLKLSISRRDDELIIRLEDNGPGFDFHKVPPPRFESTPTSGYGIYLIKKSMDSVEYRKGSPTNVLIMKKWLKPTRD